MDPNAQPSAPADTTQPAAEAAPAATPASAPETGGDKGPNLKGLPAIKKAEVIGSVGTEPAGGRSFRDRDRGPRPGRGPSAAERSGQVKAPDTRSLLEQVSAEGSGVDAELAGMLNAALASATPPVSPTTSKPAAVKGGPSAIRGPRVVQSGREHRTGKVVSVGPTDIFLEFGPKELGVVQRTQYPEDQVPVVGGEIEVVVDRFESAEQLFICSRPGAVQKAAWELLEVGQVVEARVTGVNKGGLELEVANHKAFMPAGQVSLERIEDLSVFIGEKLPCTVTQIDRRGAGNIVLSRRDMLKAEREEKAKKLATTLTEGQTLEGTVRKIMPFGAFVDIGGMDGLLHISDMTYDRVMPTEKNVAKYVKEGDKIRVQILKLDLENKRISLGMKQLMDDPFVTKLSEIVEGAEVTGKVTRLAEFGAFIEIGPGVEGLVHISEIARRRINTPADVLKQDEVVRAKVLKIDRDSRKISLSIKALLPVEAAAPGSRDAKAADRAKAQEERLKEIQKETPELRRQREKFRNKELSGGFGQKFDDGGGLAGLMGLKLGK